MKSAATRHETIITQAPKHAVIYCRVSGKKQAIQGAGLESQEHRCRAYAEQRGYIVDAVFPDDFTGGGDFMKRPGMVALLSYLDAKPHENYVVIFDDLKRYARDTIFHLELRQTMAERGATRECLNFTFEDTPEGRFIETLFAAQGQLEREQNARQVQQKMKARMETGYWIHNPPVGYRYETVRGRGKVLMPNEPFASIVREGIEGYASGRFQTQAEVKRFFEDYPEFPRNKRGELVQQRVTDILTNPIYTGHICSETYGISWLKGHHEALISMATFDKVQDRRAGVAKVPARKDIGEDFALRGFVCCASCGTPLRSSWSKGRTKSYPYYLCQTKGCDAYGKSIARDTIEGDVEAVIKSLQPTQNAVALAKDLFCRAWDFRHAQAAKLKASLHDHIASIDKQIDGLMERLLDTTNQVVMRRYEDKIESLERDKARYRDQMAHITGEKRKSYAEQLEPALNIVTKPWKLWASGNITLRRLVLKLAFADRLHYDRKTGPRTAEFAMPFKALDHVQGIHLNNGAGGGTRTRTA